MTNARRLISGDLDQGAFGPTLLLKLQSPEGAELLVSLIRRAQSGESAVLQSSEVVELTTLERLEMRLARDTAQKRLKAISPKQLVWSCTTAEWREIVELLKPLAEGQSGHQYLTSEQDDDVLIEVSLGESRVRL